MNQKYKISFIIKYHRKQLGFSQKKLADLAGVGKTVIFDLERGKETVGINIILKVFGALKIDVCLESPLTKDLIHIKY